MIPPFRADGYLPDGLHQATEAEVTFRFGAANRRRRRFVLRIRRWVELARDVDAIRLMVDGSFVTSKEAPNDVDAVIWLPADFEDRIDSGDRSALDLEAMLEYRSPEELFGVQDEADWNEWLEFFSRTREADGRRKGLVEIEL